MILDVKAMTDDEINIFISEFCRDENRYNYTGSLDSMDMAIRYLNKISKPFMSNPQPNRIFLFKLLEICNPDIKLWDNGTFLGNIHHGLNTSNATARQRAEAFVLMVRYFQK